MDTVDRQGNIAPVFLTENPLVSRKIADKEGHGQGPAHRRRPQQLPEELAQPEGEEATVSKHAIDIVV